MFGLNRAIPAAVLAGLVLLARASGNSAGGRQGGAHG
jgi:hypothetical protein